MTGTLHILPVTAPDAEARLRDYGQSLHTYLIEIRSNPTALSTHSPLHGQQLGMHWRARYILSLAPYLGTVPAQRGVEALVARLEGGQVCVLLCTTEAHGRLVAGLVEREMAARQTGEVEVSP